MAVRDVAPGSTADTCANLSDGCQATTLPMRGSEEVSPRAELASSFPRITVGMIGVSVSHWYVANGLAQSIPFFHRLTSGCQGYGSAVVAGTGAGIGLLLALLGVVVCLLWPGHVTKMWVSMWVVGLHVVGLPFTGLSSAPHGAALYSLGASVWYAHKIWASIRELEPAAD